MIAITLFTLDQQSVFAVNKKLIISTIVDAKAEAVFPYVNKKPIIFLLKFHPDYFSSVKLLFLYFLPNIFNYF